MCLSYFQTEPKNLLSGKISFTTLKQNKKYVKSSAQEVRCDFNIHGTKYLYLITSRVNISCKEQGFWLTNALQIFTGVYRVIKGFFCNYCRKTP